MYMLQSATTIQIFWDIKLSMHKDPAAAHASNPESSPTLSRTRSLCKKDALPKGICKRSHLCLCQKLQSFPQTSTLPKSKQTFPKLKLRLQNKGLHQSPFFPAVVVGHFPTILREAKIPLISVKTSGKDCRTLPRIWQLWSSQSDTNCLWHLENNLQNVVRTP